MNALLKGKSVVSVRAVLLTLLVALSCPASSALADWDLAPAAPKVAADLGFGFPEHVYFQSNNSSDQPSPALLRANSRLQSAVTATSRDCCPLRDETWSGHADSGRPSLDAQPNKPALKLATPTGFASQIPSLSVSGLIALALGILLGTYAAREQAE